ncbi:MAG: glutamate formimidoyltransferase [Anaerolineae bacterium]|nr:glutamate formimidoyltransferase [Anaerolineae bacterium]
MKPLVECVPNFSEGQRSEVIAEIVAAMRAVPEVRVLDVESDADHNRSVVTLIGPPIAVQAAAFQGIKTAAQLIDLDVQRGEHPRLGATDVVPFIPIHGVQMQECIALARDLGRRVGDELGIPVYLYERAALRPERENLEDVRRGEYEQLKREIGQNPARDPDFGPRQVGKAGATIIGARSYLIAFNAYLNTDDIGIARNIAKAVRHSNGGYRYIKAMGILVGGQAQVSMNFTNFRATPLHRVIETVRSEAARYGALVTRTELVGLTPQEALLDAACWYLQMDGFEADRQLLESKLAALGEEAPWGFVDAVAANSPTPGGGAVAALAGTLASALTSMVGRLTVGKSRYADVWDEMETAVLKSEKLRTALTAQIAEDSAAFDAVMLAYKLPKNEPARESTLRAAITRAAEVPLSTARHALEVLKLALSVATNGNPNAISDAATSAWMAMAAIQSAVWNVRVNANNEVISGAQRSAWLVESEWLVSQAQTTLEEVLLVATRRSQL